jgi:hypothetical protein
MNIVESSVVLGGSPVLRPTSPRPAFLEPLPTSPISTAPTTPRRSVTPTECPGAPARPVMGQRLDFTDLRPIPLEIPSVDDHRGKGILPDYVIKPEPGMPLWEKRKYLLSELERWLTSPLFHQHVKDVAILDEAGQMCDTNNWPAALVYMFHKKLAWDNNYAESCQEIYERCESFLLNGVTAHHSVTEILESCTLSDGKTILEHWETSDLDGLRDAPPLPDAEEDVEDEDLDDPVYSKNDGFVLGMGMKGDAIDLDLQVKIPLKTLLIGMGLSAAWLMLNTYVLCKDGDC